MKRLHGEPLVPFAGRPLQARLELLPMRAAGAERVARPLRVHAFGTQLGRARMRRQKSRASPTPTWRGLALSYAGGRKPARTEFRCQPPSRRFRRKARRRRSSPVRRYRSACRELYPAAGDQKDLGREPVAVLAVLAPLPGLQLARHVDQAALLGVLLHHLHQAVLEGDVTMRCHCEVRSWIIEPSMYPATAVSAWLLDMNTVLQISSDLMVLKKVSTTALS